MALHAYRFFSNTCREAMTWYQEVFGGQLEIMTVADMPADDRPTADAGAAPIDPGLVMHAALVFDDGDMLMASDDPSGDGRPASGVSLHYTAPTIEAGELIFAQLADGATVEMPYEEVFWALRFGACVDRFGTSWMISVDPRSADGA